MMKLETSRHMEADEEAGYRYEYDLSRFSAGSECLVARSYVHNPTEAHFLRWETSGVNRALVDDDLESPLFLEAVRHLRASGKTDVRWFSGRGNGYEKVGGT
jgi:hypothetical protein